MGPRHRRSGSKRGSLHAGKGVVSGESARRARRLGLDPLAALQANGESWVLDALGALLGTGMTGTNLNDLGVSLVYSDGRRGKITA